MLSVLREVGANMDPASRVIHKAAFKIVYVAPMKVRLAGLSLSSIPKECNAFERSCRVGRLVCVVSMTVLRPGQQQAGL